jgi:hypothetical protein
MRIIFKENKIHVNVMKYWYCLLFFENQQSHKSIDIDNYMYYNEKTVSDTIV